MLGPLSRTADVLKRALDLVEPTSIEAGRLNARYSIALLDDSIDSEAANIALDRAAEIADLHDDKVLKARVLIHRLQAIETLQERIAGEIGSTYLGRTVEVLIDGHQKGKWRGRTRTDKLVFVESEDHLMGRMVSVRIARTSPWSFQGRLAEAREVAFASQR